MIQACCPGCAGYFDAPAASACPWGQTNALQLPPVCLVFCAVEGVAVMKVRLVLHSVILNAAALHGVGVRRTVCSHEPQDSSDSVV